MIWRGETFSFIHGNIGGAGPKHNQANSHTFYVETEMFLFQMSSIMKLGWFKHYLISTQKEIDRCRVGPENVFGIVPVSKKSS